MQVSAALRSANLIPFAELNLEMLIGEGTWGNVHRARYVLGGGALPVLVFCSHSWTPKVA